MTETPACRRTESGLQVCGFLLDFYRRHLEFFGTTPVETIYFGARTRTMKLRSAQSNETITPFISSGGLYVFFFCFPEKKNPRRFFR